MSASAEDFKATLAFAFTADLSRSMAFYRDLLGLTPVMELESAVVFHVTGGSYVGVSEKPPCPGGAIQEFVVADRAAVDAWHNHLAGAGVPLDGSPRPFTAAGAYGFFAEDPDANRLEFLCFDDKHALEADR